MQNQPLIEKMGFGNDIAAVQSVFATLQKTSLTACGMVLSNAALKEKTTALLQTHIQQYGKPVDERIVRQLGAFKFSELAGDIMCEPATIEFSAL